MQIFKTMEKFEFRMDETWIHHFTSESNQQSVEWTAAGESRPKTQTSTGKVLASIFLDAQGILFIYYLEKGRTINSEYHSIITVFEGRNRQKTATNEEEESALSPRQCTVSQVDRNDGKTL